MMDFPNTPAVGTIVTFPSGASYRWNGGQWDLIVSSSAAQGITDGSNAPAGCIGEYMSNTGGGAPGSSSPSTLCGLTLTAGDWDVWGSAMCTSTTVAMSQFIVCLNTTSGALASQLFGISATSAIMGQNTGFHTPSQRYNFTTTTNVYLNCQVIFASGTCNVTGYIYGRRRR